MERSESTKTSWWYPDGDRPGSYTQLGAEAPASKRISIEAGFSSLIHEPLFVLQQNYNQITLMFSTYHEQITISILFT